MVKVAVSGILGVVLAVVAIVLLTWSVRKTISSKKLPFWGEFLGRWGLEALLLFVFIKFFSLNLIVFLLSFSLSYFLLVWVASRTIFKE